MNKFILENWDKILTNLFALCALCLSLYNYVRDSAKIVLKFEQGFINLSKENKIIGYASINIINISQHSRFVKSTTFINKNGNEIDISKIENRITNNLRNMSIDFEKKSEIIHEVDVKVLNNQNEIKPYDDVLIYYNIEELKKYLKLHQKIYFRYIDNSTTKKIKITKQEIHNYC